MARKSQAQAGEWTPAPAPVYPLPESYYYGPQHGPYASVSGHRHVRRDTWLRGDDGLAQLQAQLAARGYQVEATGLWDDATEVAVGQLQEGTGLEATGRADSATWRAAWETREGDAK